MIYLVNHGGGLAIHHTYEEALAAAKHSADWSGCPKTVYSLQTVSEPLVLHPTVHTCSSCTREITALSCAYVVDKNVRGPRQGYRTWMNPDNKGAPLFCHACVEDS